MKKLTTELNRDKRLLQRAELGVQTPAEFILANFGIQLEEYGKFPEKDKDGKPVPAKTQTNINKKWKSHEPIHAEYLQNAQANPTYLEDLRSSVSAAEKRLEELKGLTD